MATEEIQTSRNLTTWLTACAFKEVKIILKTSGAEKDNAYTRICKLHKVLDSEAPCQLCPINTNEYATGGHKACFLKYVELNFPDSVSLLQSKYTFLCPKHVDQEAKSQIPKLAHSDEKSSHSFPPDGTDSGGKKTKGKEK